MKQILFFAGMLMSIASFSQSEKFTKTMETTIAAFDSTRSIDGMRELANKFERIGDAEKNQWLPYYYAAGRMYFAFGFKGSKFLQGSFK